MRLIQAARLFLKQALVLLCWSIFLLFNGCQRTHREVSPAFYHWQTKFELTAPEKRYLSDLGVRKLYVKYFDVDWNYPHRQPVPKAVLRDSTRQERQWQVVPTIFITNRTFLEIQADSIPALASQVSDLIDQLSAGTGYREVQFDCDWTPRTRQKFFGFLNEFRQLHPDPKLLLSATIRLHQLKHHTATGVPPIDRGMLMVYNVGEVTNWFDDNSILTTGAAEPYFIPFAEYPLKLDIALPIFAWGIVFRQNKLQRLINNLRAAELADTSRFLKLTENRFQLKKSTYIKGAYLYEGDKIRTEAIAPEQLERIAIMMAPLLTANDFSLSFYHLDSTTIKFYPHEQLQSIAQILEE